MTDIDVGDVLIQMSRSGVKKEKLTEGAETTASPLHNSSQLAAILDEQRVRTLTSLCKSTRWRMERRGEFPKRVKLSPGRVGWRQTDIEAWIASRAA